METRLKLKIQVACEFGEVFNILLNGVRVGEVHRKELLGGGHEWRDLDGGRRTVYADGTTEMEGRQVLINGCLKYRKLREPLFNQRAANARTVGEPLPYPNAGTWTQHSENMDEPESPVAVVAVPVAPVSPPATEKKSRPRAHRGGPGPRFYAICQSVGQDPKAPEIYTLASGIAGREITSKAQLSGHELYRLGSEVEMQYAMLAAGGAR